LVFRSDPSVSQPRCRSWATVCFLAAAGVELRDELCLQSRFRPFFLLAPPDGALHDKDREHDAEEFRRDVGVEVIEKSPIARSPGRDAGSNAR
jgi:hypothetical protein